MKDISIAWILLPPGVRLALWAALGIALAFVLWRLLPRGRIRPAITLVFLLVFLLFADGGRWVKDAYNDYRAQKEQWLANKCREVVAAQRERPAQRVATEGLLIVADFDKLLNDRMHRAMDLIAAEQGNRDSLVIDTGRYEPHPVWQAVSGGSFAPMAMKLLVEKRLSYVEFEMLPQGGRDNDYSNSGMLNRDGWSGKRYRLYYLAPRGHAECVNETGDVAAPALRASIGGVPFGGGAATATRPYCLALRVTTAPLSGYRLTADEPQKIAWWLARPRGLWMPAWINLRWDRMQLSDAAGSEIRRYAGFSYPDEMTRRHACNDGRAAAAFVGDTLVPDERRSFLHSQPWYEGSEVQAFYEPGKARVAAVPQPASPPSAVPTATCPIPGPGKASASYPVDQLNDFQSGSATSIESTEGMQWASFFELQRETALSAVEWSGLMTQGNSTEEFVIRLFKDNGGLPGEPLHEMRVTASARKAGKFVRHDQPHLLDARLKRLVLPAGGYWISIFRPRTSSNFFWTAEPGPANVACGSGAALRDAGSAWRNPPQSTAARTARGFSFRLVAER